jgi:hypothetical protein
MLLIVSPAHANTLAPGELGSPDVFSSLSGLTLLASYSGSESGGGDTWDLAEAVYSTSGGDLDFMFQVTNTTAGGDNPSIDKLRFQDFSGYSTDVGYTTSGASLPGGVFVNGTIAPMVVDRTLDGSGVVFSPAEATFYDGDTSDVLVIETNATSYDGNGLMDLVFNDDDPSASAFEPTGPTGVPEPRTTALLGAGLLLIAAMRRRFA